MVSVPKVRVPLVLFCKETEFVPPLLAAAVPTAVLPKLMSRVDWLTSMPCDVEAETVVEPKATVPAT